MPLCRKDIEHANELAREARRFAALVERAPRDEEAPEHPQLKTMTDAFQKINEILAAANARSSFAGKEMSTVAGHFSDIGKTLETWR